MVFSQHDIDQIILEDLPLHDETSRALGLDKQPGKIEIRAREAGMICGLQIANQMAASLNLKIMSSLRDGDVIQTDRVMAATGGVKRETAAAYAQTGVDLLITSSPYHAKPADFGAKISC
jgi:molybdenum transport protein